MEKNLGAKPFPLHNVYPSFRFPIIYTFFGSFSEEYNIQNTSNTEIILAYRKQIENHIVI